MCGALWLAMVGSDGIHIKGKHELCSFVMWSQQLPRHTVRLKYMLG